MTTYIVRIRNERSDDDGWGTDLGPVPPATAWWEVQLPPCPDCGGDMVWYEAGHVPGTRRCMGAPIRRHEDSRPIYDHDGGCGSMFSVQASGGRVMVRRERFCQEA
jgi:hypothetical protein